MAQLIVRNIEEEVVQELRRNASEAGISMEEAHRRLLREALLAKRKPTFLEHLMAMPSGGRDEDFERPVYPERAPFEFD